MNTGARSTATSAQLVSFTQATNCMINSNWDSVLATSTARATFAGLGNAVVDLNYVVINCYA